MILQSLQINQDVKLEISDALAAGKEVTVHEKDIHASGWTGSGYVVFDPETAAGAYKIAGGSNGGNLSSDVSALVFGMLTLDQSNCGGESNFAAKQSASRSASLSLVSGPCCFSASVSPLSDGVMRAINAVTFAKTLLTALIDCFLSDLVDVILLIVLVVAVGFLIKALSGGFGTAAALAMILTVLLGPKAALAAQDKECKIQCSKASDAQLAMARITNPEGFKAEEGFGPPTSAHDICACKDGSILIYRVGNCGKITPTIPPYITDRRWKP